MNFPSRLCTSTNKLILGALGHTSFLLGVLYIFFLQMNSWIHLPDYSNAGDRIQCFGRCPNAALVDLAVMAIHQRTPSPPPRNFIGHQQIMYHVSNNVIHFVLEGCFLSSAVNLFNLIMCLFIWKSVPLGSQLGCTRSQQGQNCRIRSAQTSVPFCTLINHACCLYYSISTLICVKFISSVSEISGLSPRESL